jgi:hypothetical protein
MTMIDEWPSWHPDQELKAEHLLALEDYLLTRIFILEEGAYGIESLDDWKQSIQIEESGGVLTVKVGQLRGITQDGAHVWLWNPKEWLETSLDASGEDNTDLDLWIVVNSRIKDAPKLTLRAEVANHAQAVKSGDPPGDLYLGRYRFGYRSAKQSIEIVHRPMPRKLSGFGRADDEDWQKWVEPLIARLEALAREISGQRDTSPSSLAVAVELSRLSFEWPTLLIPVLARRLRMVDWLRNRSRNPRLGRDMAAVIAPFPLHELTGDTVPGRLAQLIPIYAHETSSVGLSLNRLLKELLANSGVKYYAPVSALHIWAENLENSQFSFASSEDRIALFREVEDALTQCQHGAGNKWSRSVALITTLSIRSATGWDGPQGALDPYLIPGVTDLSENASRALEELYFGEAKDARAGPLGFYWLARAASRQPELWKRSSPDLSSYFQRIGSHPTSAVDTAVRRGSTVSNARAIRAKSADRVSGFLIRVGSRPPEPAEILPYAWSTRILVSRLEFDAISEIRITVVGSPESGKTSLIHGLAQACRGTAAPRVPFDVTFESASDLTGDNSQTELEGRLVLDRRTIGIRVTDSSALLSSSAPQHAMSGPSQSSLIENQASPAELLIITVAPETVDHFGTGVDVNRLTDFSRLVLQKNRNAKVAIAYTKADEYGVVNRDSIRLLYGESQSKALEDFRTATDVEQLWDLFVEGTPGAGSDVRRDGMAIISRAGKNRQHEMEWSDTRRWILRQTRELWEMPLRHKSSALLNGYFVSAKPSDSYLDPWAQRGLLQILSDYLYCLTTDGNEQATIAHEAGGVRSGVKERGVGRRPFS